MACLKETTLASAKERVVPMFQSARPAKRFKSCLFDDASFPPSTTQTTHFRRSVIVPASPSRPKSPSCRDLTGQDSTHLSEVAPTASMAPMAPMDIPAVPAGESAIEVQTIVAASVAATPATASTRGHSLIGGFGRLIGVFGGQKEGPAPENSTPAAGEGEISAKSDATKVGAEKEEHAKEPGDDSVDQLENQLQDSVKETDAHERAFTCLASIVCPPVSLEEPVDFAAAAPPAETGKAIASAPSAPKQKEDEEGVTAKPELHANETNEADDSEIFEIDKILEHRQSAEDHTLLELRISWKTENLADEFTWEPEANVQEDARTILFKYWRTVKGGRKSAVVDPDLWHVLQVEGHHLVPSSGDVLLDVAWIGSQQRSWEPEAAVSEYAQEHVDDYWERVGGRDEAVAAAGPEQTTERKTGPKTDTKGARGSTSTTSARKSRRVAATPNVRATRATRS
ncbi:hypothetical protein EDB81DRAFT_951705 [Dactylonectria macrodidyma]|uniref:Chromo domain-containing protein n=1 Tax=Dactylonectria macrodidyma TaxID=307937 RepID=A0A9P9ILG8_9HYPO|nr:hypothetical protein EDB81DRAFT_951705 [Dactylonectria macrodidyma]